MGGFGLFDDWIIRALHRRGIFYEDPLFDLKFAEIKTMGREEYEKRFGVVPSFEELYPSGLA